MCIFLIIIIINSIKNLKQFLTNKLNYNKNKNEIKQNNNVINL